MSDFLEQVVASRREYVREAKRTHPPEELLRSVPAASSAVDPFTLLLRGAKDAGQLAVIGEIKRTSPAAGRLASPTLTAAMQALLYQSGGATAISVLTEPQFWGGSLADLREARAAAPGTPILCKDVIVDEYQILEARAAGADAVLLIAEALTDAQLAGFRRFAASLSMGTLVEAHEAAAFGRAVASGSAVVGINARDLRQPKQLDVGRVRQLHSFARDEQVLVAESGIETSDDVRLLPRRVDAILVGTALMRSTDPSQLMKQLRGARGPVLA